MTNKEILQQLSNRYPSVKFEQFSTRKNGKTKTEQEDSEVKTQILGLLPAYESFLQAAGVEENDIRKTIENIESDYTIDEDGETKLKTADQLSATLDSLNAIMPFQKEITLNPSEEQTISLEPQDS